MSKDEYARLVENVRTDGGLTSTPLCCLQGDVVEILSGHHRTLAAIDAGMTEIDAIVITTPLSEERKTAIQLAHNSVVGKDDPSTLADLYRQLGLTAKMFSGLTDAVLDVDKMMISGFQAGVEYEELRIAFLPEDKQSFELALKRMAGAKGGAVITHLARYRDFDAIFDATVKVKDKRQVRNSALAFAVMAELALQRLDELEAEDEAKAAAIAAAAAAESKAA